jgi:hypothetical protein
VSCRGPSLLGALVTVGALTFSGGALTFSGGALALSCCSPALSCCSPADPSSESHADSSVSSHLQVTEVEYRLILSRGVVKAGPVYLEAIDGGMDPHDLRLDHVGLGKEIAAPELTSGRRWDGIVNLKPGVYRLWCSLPEHAKLGMRATLRVVR